ncbi:Pyruvate kinase family protein isoform 1 [Hibiscus syriacus]|uniref:Pyruvate kinase family protein isoform 1 n=1 Tax=Hibiscus syriacus TaxID=106335 RepID=A0A6A2WMN6_HIBSY|nr:Pyruvate kinase family protein isoform 1 [Hibiscus syriacus]
MPKKPIMKSKLGKKPPVSPQLMLSTDYEKSLCNQRQRSMDLNREGLEGLVPRAKLLLTLGGTFFLGFWPLILSTIAFFSALYLYFGSSFIHDGSKTPVSPPQFIDPCALLEDERISGTPSPLN